MASRIPPASFLNSLIISKPLDLVHLRSLDSTSTVSGKGSLDLFRQRPQIQFGSCRRYTIKFFCNDLAQETFRHAIDNSCVPRGPEFVGVVDQEGIIHRRNIRGSVSDKSLNNARVKGLSVLNCFLDCPHETTPRFLLVVRVIAIKELI